MKKQLWLFLIGGTVYYLIELVWKGSSHWSMFLVGGICFRFIGWIRTLFGNMQIIWQCLLCGVTITLIEFISGCLVNLRYQCGVWDYSNLPFNVFGQICLPFTAIWSGLSFAAIKADSLFSKHFHEKSRKSSLLHFIKK